MLFFLSVALLANVSASSYTKIQTTVNGNTTTVESNEPGAIRVEKTDTTESIMSDNPVTVTYSSDSSNQAPLTQNPPNWISLLRSLWDRIKTLMRFDILTR